MQASTPSQETTGEVSSADVVRGRILIFIAAILWSTSGLFAKSTFFDQWPIYAKGSLLAFWRALFAGFFMLTLVKKRSFRPAMAPMTLCFALMNITFLSAMTLTTAANTIWLQHIAPAWVFLIGVLFLKEPIIRKNCILLGFAAVGISIILYFEMTQGAAVAVVAGYQQEGIIFGILGGLTYAGVILFLRHLRNEDSAWLIVINHLVTAALIAPYIVYLLLSKNIVPTWPQIAILAGFGIVQMGTPYLLFAKGLKLVPPQEASSITLLEPILVPIWVFIAYSESPAWWSILGASFILVGLVIRFGWKAKSNEQL